MLAIGISLLLFALIGMGIPLAFALGASGCLGVWLIGGFDPMLAFLTTTPVTTAGTYELMTIPMFVLMAEFVIVSGVAEELFDTIDAWTRHLRGGLGISTVLTGAGFSSICGSSAAAAATLASTAIPQMRRHGYDMKLATGLTAIVGTLSSMIPPANGLIIYGVLSGADLGKLLIAGIIPGMIGVVVLTVTLQVLIRRNPALIRERTDPQPPLWTRIRMLSRVLPMTLLFLVVVGVMYFGIGTPTEASAMGAVGALLITAQRRRLNWTSLYKALRATARISAMITMVITGALLFGYFLTMSQATQTLTTAIGDLPTSRWVIIALLLAIKLLLGCFMDQVALLVLTVPITLPIVVQLGFDPIWYGIVLALTSEIGLVTPPIGLNVYIVGRYAGVPVDGVFRGVFPFMLAMLLYLVVLTAFPAIALWLPGLMQN
ncbi:MAG: C4-dicarboxylate ABC transporter permease [Rhodospirillales bacterium 70-18]|nr:TRAP transporter large permease [Rhodospirillales bacterium]OJY73096.1 MAG: C4-dicarboxylate ABC transporter permease [Rhodospirillales bacterium 70-18]